LPAIGFDSSRQACDDRPVAGDPPHDPGRKDARFRAELRVNVTCREWSQVEQMVTLNASRGGLFLRTTQTPALGMPLRLDVQLPDGTRLSLSATVVHVVTAEAAATSGRPAGVGVKFDTIHAADLHLLEAMAQAAPIEPAEPAAPAVAAVALPIPAPAAPAADRPAGTPVPVNTDRPPVVIGRLKSARTDESEQPDATRRSEVVFGIDYGTTYSSIAMVQEGRAFVIPDEVGRLLMPSIVAYPEGGGVLVGWDARGRVATDPGHTVHSAKRVLGRRTTEMEVANHLAQQAYPSSAGPGQQVVLEIGRTPVSIPQIVAEVLRRLKRTAERAVGVAVEDVVLTVPVTWGAAPRDALRKAAGLAGMRVVGLIDEPAAAGLIYGFAQEKNEIVAVYDFSGGTFDFTVIDISRESLRMLASAGDAWLGGDDFDLVLAKDVANQFWKQHKIELQKRLVEWQQLIWACETAKRTLTRVDRALIEVPAIARSASGPLHLRTEMQREQFERLGDELVSRSLDIVVETLRGLDLEPRDIGQVIVTGGCTKIPMVRAAVARLFEREPEAHVNPDEAVALGAAVQGALLARTP
jgi:hypothetical protein